MFEHGPTWAWIVGGIAVALIIAAAVFAHFSDDFDRNVAAFWSFIFVAIIAVGIPLAVRADHQYQVWCQAQGGHVTSNTTYGTTVTTGGHVGTTSSTTTYCLSADGRIIDIQ
jgi:hypothetical protein